VTALVLPPGELAEIWLALKPRKTLPGQPAAVEPAASVEPAGFAVSCRSSYGRSVIASDRKYLADLDYYETKLAVVGITPAVPDVQLLDFSHTAELIETGYRHARARLRELRGCPTS
jgi:hypothetical protein